MGVYPKNGWFNFWTILLKWMSWGYSHFRKPTKWYTKPTRSSPGTDDHDLCFQIFSPGHYHRVDALHRFAGLGTFWCRKPPDTVATKVVGTHYKCWTLLSNTCKLVSFSLHRWPVIFGLNHPRTLHSHNALHCALLYFILYTAILCLSYLSIVGGFHAKDYQRYS